MASARTTDKQDMRLRQQADVELESKPNGHRAPAAEVHPAPGTAPEVNPFRWFILAGLITAAILQVLDTTIVNVALPQMAGNLGATNQEIGWVVTGYILSNVIVLPMTAFLAERFGRKRYLTTSIIIFIAASFFCGTSTSLQEIVFWRILQGAGGAALLSTAQATLVEVFPSSEQGVIQPIFMIALTVAPTLGPTLGGWLTDNFSWNWCFLINVPVGIVSAALVIMFLHDKAVAKRTAVIDWLGIFLLAVGLGSMQYVLQEGQQNDWFNDNTIVGWTIVSAVSMISLMAWLLSKKNRHPIIDLRVLNNKTLSAAMILFVVLGFSLYGGTYLFPLLAQTILGFSSLQTGFALLPGGLATIVSILVCGAILNRPKPLVDARLLIGFGTVLMVISLWQLSHLTPQAGQSDTTLALLIRGFGMGFLFVPINQAAFASLKRADLQQASGLLSLARQLGGSFGIALLATYVNNHIQYHRAELLTNYNMANGQFVDRLNMLAGGLAAHGYGAISAKLGSLSVLNQILMRQALVMSYNDSFMMILVFSICTVPAILLLGRAKMSFGNPPGHAVE